MCAGENLRRIRQVGRAPVEAGEWLSSALAETSIFRYKTIEREFSAFGDRLRTRKVENQFNEMFIKCAALNRMTHLGMPESYKVSR
jgi:hypothetical protein